MPELEAGWQTSRTAVTACGFRHWAARPGDATWGLRRETRGGVMGILFFLTMLGCHEVLQLPVRGSFSRFSVSIVDCDLLCQLWFLNG